MPSSLALPVAVSFTTGVPSTLLGLAMVLASAAAMPMLGRLTSLEAARFE